jgi:dihydroxy-acid dehydratase
LPLTRHFGRSGWPCRDRSVCGGRLALIAESASITIDVHELLLQLKVSDEEFAPPSRVETARYTRGVLAKFAKLMSTASQGAVTDKGL